jgi:hypothetical protein
LDCALAELAGTCYAYDLEVNQDYLLPLGLGLHDCMLSETVCLGTRFKNGLADGFGNAMDLVVRWLHCA